MGETGGIEKAIKIQWQELILRPAQGWCSGNDGKGTKEYVGLVFIFIANIYCLLGIIF